MCELLDILNTGEGIEQRGQQACGIKLPASEVRFNQGLSSISTQLNQWNDTISSRNVQEIVCKYAVTLYENPLHDIC